MAKSYTKLKILKNKTKHFTLALGMTGLFLSVPSTFGEDDKTPFNTTEIKYNQTTVKEPVATISYQTDTLYQATSSLLLCVQDKITRNYVENNYSYRMQLPYFVHEDWHHHNYKSGFRTTSKLSSFEYYKLCIQDEMTANLTAILTARLEYLGESDKDAVIKKYENSYMGFYFKAIKEKKIVPSKGSMSDEEKRLLANGVRDMWLSKYYKGYAPALWRMIPRYIKRCGSFKENPKEYKKYVQNFWTIGGINFSDFLDSDIDVFDEKVYFSKAAVEVLSFKEDADFLIQDVASFLSLLKDFAVSDQMTALEHMVVAAKLKAMIKNFDNYNLTYNKKAINIAYQKACFDLAHDETFKLFAGKYLFMVKDNFNLYATTENFEQKIRQFYSYKGVDLSAQINGAKFDKTPLRDKSEFRHEILTFYFAANAALKPIKAPAEFDHAAEVTTPKQAPLRQRLSAPQYLDIPNFWEPILVGATSEQEEEIINTVRSFEAIPAVLKGCNIKALKKYYEDHGNDSILFAKRNVASR